ncbi:MAG TPA: hypothetical protein VFQ25_00545 [Ktedonobacterales bacterium]|nr:hypothetical protein [Ktedonobacterales bacterium]
MAPEARGAGGKTDEARQGNRMGRLADGAAPMHGWAGALVAWTARYPRAPLWLALAVAVIARVALVIKTGAVIDGDEALVGIQAEHILRGQFPVYFYGQSYMGSLETYLIAAVVAVTGPSVWALRVVPIAMSLALVYLTWRLALALLPREWRATPLLAGLAALVAAAPPLYVAVTELRAWGGQIEMYVITLALLLATVELSQRLRDDAGTGEMARRWAIWGLLAGLGLWVNPLISYALVACGLWLAVAVARRLAAGGRASVKGSGLGALAAIAGATLGGLPAWVYAIQTGGANVAVYLTQPAVSAHDTPVAAQGRLALASAITRAYVACAAPRALDGSLPGESAAWALARLALLALPVAGLLLALWLTLGRRAARMDAAPQLGLPLLYAASVSAIFCLGTSAWPILKGCDLDLAGRYAVPLALIEPFLLLALFSAPLAWAALRPATGPRALRGLWVAALVVLLAGGALQSASYALANPQRTFQSPYYPYGMSDSSELLAYLRAHHIHAAWCNHWIGNIVTYATNGQTVCADYYDQVYHHGLVRPTDSIARVQTEPAPSFILNLTEPKPVLARELDALGVPYTLAVLPRSGVTVITPERAVDPAKLIAGLAEDYGTNLHR